MDKDHSTDTPTVLIPCPEVDTIKNVTANEKDNNRETGGVLLGRRVSPDKIFCITATRPGPNAEQHRAEFAPDIEYAQSIIDDYRTQYDVVWIGTWHKHPGSMNRLSNGDKSQMREFIHDSDLLDEIIAIVTTYDDGVVKLNPFYMEESLEPTRIDLEIVDDIKEYKTDIEIEGQTEQQNNDSNEGPSEATIDVDVEDEIEQSNPSRRPITQLSTMTEDMIDLLRSSVDWRK